MAELIKVNAPVRKPLFDGVQGENEARSIQFDITPWVTELGDGVVTATAKRSQDSQPYPVTVTKVGNIVTWKPTSTDTAFAGVGSFQLEYTVDSVLAKTCIWSTMVAPSLDPAGDPPDPYDNWLAEMRQIAADALQSEQNAEDSAEDAEAWAVGQRGGVDVPSTDETYHNNAKYWAEQSLANQYGAYIVKSASGEIASFSDGADDVPMKSLNVTITPKQAGSGDPSPSNVRPITGYSTVNVIVSPTTTASDGTTTPIPLGQTVYGGSVNPISGELVIDTAILDLGSFTWSRHATYTNCYSVLGNSLPFPAPINVCYDGLCEQYKVWYTGADVPVSVITSASNNGYLFISPSRWSTSNKSIVVNDNRGLSEGAFKTAMNGVHLVCPLATPTTTQLTPAQVASLLGTNNVWADCGAVEVEYRADPTLAYAELEALILENI